MRHWNDNPPRRSRIEIIPMIDVMMFLLVFFVLISINVIPATGIKTKLPVSSSVQDNKSVRNAIINIPKAAPVQLDGKNIELATLTATLQKLKHDSEKLQVIVNGDAGVELQRLVDVMDAVKASGVDAISISARRKAG
jgi:biopolymer transport protein ExbD